MTWRPDDWENPHDFRNPDHVDNPYVEMECANAYEHGASNMLADLLKRLFEPCDKHPDCGEGINAKTPHACFCYPSHRYLCPQCMNELRGEK